MREQRQWLEWISELLDEFEVKVGMHQGSVLSPFLLVVVVNVVTEFTRENSLSELSYVMT